MRRRMPACVYTTYLFKQLRRGDFRFYTHLYDAVYIYCWKRIPLFYRYNEKT